MSESGHRPFFNLRFHPPPPTTRVPKALGLCSPRQAPARLTWCPGLPQGEQGAVLQAEGLSAESSRPWACKTSKENQKKRPTPVAVSHRPLRGSSRILLLAESRDLAALADPGQAGRMCVLCP